MPNISFYVLAPGSEQKKLLFVCKLAEKVYRSGKFCYIRTDGDEQSAALDDLLWTFSHGSFIPHQIDKGPVPARVNTILIGSGSTPENWRSVQINLSKDYPDDYMNSERILEVLDDEESKAAGRERYRQYQQSGLPVATHHIS